MGAIRSGLVRWALRLFGRGPSSLPEERPLLEANDSTATTESATAHSESATSNHSATAEHTTASASRHLPTIAAGHGHDGHSHYEPLPEGTVLIAKGTGGQLELYGNCLRLTKGGTFGFFAELLGIEGGFVERTIRVSDISAVELDKPAFFFRYVRFSYPGAPSQTGHNLEDMMAENALLMSMFDNRNLYRIKEEIERSMNRQVGL